MDRFKELVFKESENPAIRFFKTACFWVMDTWPNIAQWTGVKMVFLNILWVMLGITFIYWLAQELYSPWAILFKTLVFALIACIVHAHMFAAMIYSFLYIWEDKGKHWFEEKA